jgi:hypothetical protein
MRLAFASLAPILLASNAFAQAVPPPSPSGPAAPASPPVAPAPLPPPPPPPPPQTGDLHLDVATLLALRERGHLTEEEYDTALRDMNDSIGHDAASEAPTFVLGKFSTTFYGRAKADFIYDSTESFSDLAGNSLIQRPNLIVPPGQVPIPINYAGNNPRMTFSIRDSRFGFYVRAPEVSGVRVSGLLEMDFFGDVASNATEQQSYSTAIAPRLRHYYFRVENPIVDILVGQYWHLFGWQNAYHPASVQAQGLVGELYSRDLQVRLSKTLASPWLSVEVAAAVLRPPQRDSGKPQEEVGLRVMLNKWTGLMTNGASGTSLAPLSVGVSANFRDMTVPEMSLTPQASVDLGTHSIAVDAYVPIIPATATRKGNALSVHGEYVSGYGIADLYTSLNGGIGFPAIPLNGVQGAAYPQNIDNGLVTFDGVGNLHAIQWTTYLAGLQYYLPFTNGKALIAANYGHIESNNIALFTQTAIANPSVLTFAQATAVIHQTDLYDFDLITDIAYGVRIGIEGAYYRQEYVDGTTAKDVRLQAGAMFVF